MTRTSASRCQET